MLRAHLSVVSVCLLVSSLAPGAVYDNPYLPDWSALTGYASDFWALNGPTEPVQPASPDVYADNPNGSSTATWTSYSSGLVAWINTPPQGSFPAWMTGEYGGMVSTPGGPWTLTATVATAAPGAGETVTLFVQYDWYPYTGGAVTVGVEDAVSSVVATDVTPGTYYDLQIGQSGSGYPIYRTSKVFSLASSTGLVDVDLTLTGTIVMVDSFSVTSAIDAPVPPTMPVPEPATAALLGAGTVLLARRRRGPP